MRSPCARNHAMANFDPCHRSVAEEAVYPFDNFGKHMLHHGGVRPLNHQLQCSFGFLSSGKTDRFGCRYSGVTRADNLIPTTDHGALHKTETTKGSSADFRHKIGNSPCLAAARAMVRKTSKLQHLEQSGATLVHAALDDVDAMAAAMAGGVTSLVCPPDTDPPLDEPGLVEMLKFRARNLNQARLYPLGALTRELKGEALTEMAELTEAGCVGFSQAEAAVRDTLVLQRALAYASTFGYAVWLRPNDPWLGNGVAAKGPLATRMGDAWTAALAALHSVPVAGVAAQQAQQPVVETPAVGVHGRAHAPPARRDADASRGRRRHVDHGLDRLEATGVFVPLDHLARHLVHREEVETVDLMAGHAEAGGATELAAADRPGAGRGLGIAIVLDHEDHRQIEHAGEVVAFQRGALVRRTVADEGDGNPTGLERLRGGCFSEKAERITVKPQMLLIRIKLA